MKKDKCPIKVVFENATAEQVKNFTQYLYSRFIKIAYEDSHNAEKQIAK